MVAAPLLSLCSLLLLITPSVALAARTWAKVETPDVTVYSEARPKEVLEFVVGYSGFRHAFDQLMPAPQKGPRTVVLLFRDLATLREHCPGFAATSQAICCITEVDGTAVLGLAVEGDLKETLRQVIQAETVWLMNRTGWYVPLWMAQGAGEVLDRMKVEESTLRIPGRLPGVYADWSSPHLSWDRFFEMTTSSPEYAGPQAKGLFHARAFAVMHHVLLDGNRGAKNFRDLASRVQSMDPAAALESVLHVPTEEFERSFKLHLRKSSAGVALPFDAAALRQRLIPAEISLFDVHVFRAHLLIGAGKPNEAELALAQAEAITPNALPVLEARARAAWLAGQKGEALRRYREAIARGSTNFMAYLLSAEDRVTITGQAFNHAGEGGPRAEEALREIRRAVELNPQSPEAYRVLGRVLFVAPDVSAQDVEQLERGVSRGPTGQAVRYYRALLHERLGNRTEYVRDLRDVYSDPFVLPSVRKNVAERLVKAEFEPLRQEVEPLVQARRFDEARQRIAEAKVADLSPVSAAVLKKFSAWIDDKAQKSAAPN